MRPDADLEEIDCEYHCPCRCLEQSIVSRTAGGAIGATFSRNEEQGAGDGVMTTTDDASPGPVNRIAQLEQLLSLEPVASGFRGSARGSGNGRVFGGQIVAQALRAAFDRLGAAQQPNSLHAYFVRAGDEGQPIDYAVTVERTGRNYSTVRVEGRQSKGTIVTLIASFHEQESGLLFQPEVPDVPSPEVLAAGALASAGTHPLEVRMVPPSISDGTSAVTQRYAWFRTVAPVTATPKVQASLLAYASDLLLLGTSVLPHGLTLRSPGLRAASLDHSLWFNQLGPLDDWLLYAATCMWSGHGRSLTRGSIFDRQGVLVASVAQECMLRLAQSSTA